MARAEESGNAGADIMYTSFMTETAERLGNLHAK